MKLANYCVVSGIFFVLVSLLHLLRIVNDYPVQAGEYTVPFDGQNDRGVGLASGIYFLRLRTPSLLQVRQIAIPK